MKFHYRKAPAVTEYSVASGDARTEGDLRIVAKDIPCQEACPAHTNVPEYIELITQGRYADSYAVNLECNVFPGVLGRVCTRPCEDRCRHNWTNTNGPVTICHLKRVAADQVEHEAVPPAALFGESGKRVAIIGGGPAGLAAARELRRFGHQVTIYERQTHLGGMMMDGIPRFRLPHAVVQQEIELILKTGIQVKTGVDVDAAHMETLIADNDAVCIAAGTMKVRSLSLDGLPEGVAISGLDFMNRYNNDEISHLEGDVVVIGGGFTAVDCSRSSARAARRLLGEGDAVSIVYRRSEQFMAANMQELEEIERENIHIRTLLSPVGVRMDDGQLAAVVFERNRIIDDGSDEKPRIEAVPDSGFEIPARHLIVAIGQSQEWEILPAGLALTDGFCTSNPRVFATGDFATGSDNVIKAVANGKNVATEIDRFLMGHDRIEELVKVDIVNKDGHTGRVRDHDIQAPAYMPVIPVPERAVENREVESGFDPEDAYVNGMRCYFCHYKFEIDQDVCIHCDWCIDAAPRECIKKVSRLFHDKNGVVETVVEATLSREATYIWIDSDECIRCGKCLRVCPVQAISMKKAARIRCPRAANDG